MRAITLSRRVRFCLKFLFDYMTSAFNSMGFTGFLLSSSSVTPYDLTLMIFVGFSLVFSYSYTLFIFNLFINYSKIIMIFNIL